MGLHNLSTLLFFFIKSTPHVQKNYIEGGNVQGYLYFSFITSLPYYARPPLIHIYERRLNMPDTVQKPKAAFRPKPKGDISPPDIAESSSPVPHDYLVPMFRNYEYARVVMRATSPYEAKGYAEELFGGDGWDVYPDYENYKIVDIPSGGYV